MVADGAAKQCISFQRHRVNEPPSCISSGAVPFLGQISLQTNMWLIQEEILTNGQISFHSFKPDRFPVRFWPYPPPPHPIKYNNGLCHQFITADIDILFEIQWCEITLHDITCYWSEKQPTPCRIQLVHISPRCRKLTENTIMGKKMC